MVRLDALAVFVLERVSDKVEERYGRTVARWVTLAMCLTVIAALTIILFILI